MNTPEPIASDLRTREETAHRLRIAVVTLDGWVKAGKGPAPTRLEGRVFFRDDEIERFIESRTARPLSERAAKLAALIEPELATRLAPATDEPLRSMIQATATLAATISVANDRMRAKPFTDAEARQFVSAVKSLTEQLCALGSADLGETLAEDIAGAALATATDLFPSLLPGELQ